MATGNQSRAYGDDAREKPIERTRARKSGGSFRMTLRAESARAIGLEPADTSPDTEVEFLVSEVDDCEGRLVLDRLEKQPASD